MANTKSLPNAIRKTMAATCAEEAMDIADQPRETLSSVLNNINEGLEITESLLCDLRSRLFGEAEDTKGMAKVGNPSIEVSSYEARRVVGTINTTLKSILSRL